jgi:phytoene synthase
LIDALPAPQRLALTYSPRRARGATLAVLALDARLAGIVRGRGMPIASQLRLAWWREMLERPPSEWPRGEPQLEALREWRAPAALAALSDAWEALLVEQLTTQAIAAFAEGRGRAFAALAWELGVEDTGNAAAAARIWALADLTANLSDAAERALVVAYAKDLAPPPRLPASLRPLAVLAGLGASALARGGGALLSGPVSAFHALRIGLTGR